MLRKAEVIAVKTIQDFYKDRCGTNAAALAYYALFAMPAVLLVAVNAAAALYGRESAPGQVQKQLTTLLGPQSAQAFQTMIAATARAGYGGVLANALAFGGFAYSALTAVYQLQQSLNQAWDVDLDRTRVRSFMLKRIASFVLIVVVGLVLEVSLAAVPALSLLKSSLAPTGSGVIYPAEVLVSWTVFTLLLGVILKVVPDAEIGWRDVWVGAALTSALIVIGKFLIGLYLSHAGMTAYGAVGSIAALLLWIYYSAAILLLGVEFTHVWKHEHGELIRPEEGAIRVGRKGEVSAPIQARV